MQPVAGRINTTINPGPFPKGFVYPKERKGLGNEV
jgi:hypothetical protein